MAYVRWREGINVVLLHPETGIPTTPVPGELRQEDDPLVAKFRWAFFSDEEKLVEDETARLAAAGLRPEDIAGREAVVGVEQATKAPGEKRTTRKRASKASS